MKINLEVGPEIAVPKILSQDQVRFFVENGYLVVPDLMTAAEIEALRREAAFIVRGGYPTPGIGPLPAEVGDDEVMQNILCIHQPHFIIPVMQHYVHHPKIFRILSQMIAAP